TGIADKRKNHKNLSLNLPRRIETPRKPCDPPSQEPQHLTHYEHGPAQILPNLFLGACHTAQRRDVLERHGISCILNVAHEINLTPPPGSSYHHLKWTHTQNNLARREFHRAIRVLEMARQSDTNVLVHCQSGVERSATLIIAYILYLSRKQPALIGKRLTLSEAYDYVRTRAPAIRPNMELMYQLSEFELM
ncbi:protein-tyrosine phosphatase-like protein, partial [Fennellomyces sp. T-0311]